MKHTLITISTLFNLKKIKHFLNITEYKIFPLKSFLITYLLFVTYMYVYSSIRSQVIANIEIQISFENHFRILNARMVQSVESVWTVLYYRIVLILPHSHIRT